MSDELREKLKTIVTELHNNRGFYLDASIHIRDIEQAFKDAGYRSSKQVLDEIIEHLARKGDLLTGQEWYERYEAEFKGTRPSYSDGVSMCNKAAKRAAGIV